MIRAPHQAAVLFAMVLCLLAVRAQAAELSTGQTVYVPCYSHIYHGVKTRPIALTITLSVRNTDPGRVLTLESVDYHNTEGKLVKRYLDKPLRLEPLMTVEYLVGENDASGGSGANFMVRWSAEEPANPLFVEAVMIGTSGQQGISFTSQGLPLAGQ